MANGNDSAIVENGGELNTDDYSDIKLINKTEYDSLEDTEKPLWVKNHQKDVKLQLDNDMTFPVFVDEYNNTIWAMDYEDSGLTDEDIELNEFTWYLGWNDGVKILLECYGIKNWEEV